MAIAKGERKQFVRLAIVRVEHVLYAEKVVVGDPFGHVEVLRRNFGVLQCSYQRLEEVQFVDLKVDFKQLIDHVDHRFAFRGLQTATGCR